MRFVTLFPEAENIHLTKDVGMIGYILHKYYSYSSKIVCYKNSENYTYLDDILKGLEIEYIKKYTGNTLIDGLLYLFKRARKIDVLHIFHITSNRNLYWILLYKLLNPRGKVYLKMDANIAVTNYNVNGKTLRNRMRIKILKKCKLISVETLKLYEYCNENWPLDVEYIPNGFYDYGNTKIVDYQDKENVICTVGRIGTKEKATEVLLEAYRLASVNLPGWKLRVVGPIEKEFEEYINDYFEDNAELRKNIVFTGAIYDREKLNLEYKRAKIFCLTSKYESFGIVMVEALRNGCYIVTSRVDSANDLTNKEKYGSIFEVDNSEELAGILINICNKGNKLADICSDIQKFAYENFEWVKLCESIHKNLK